MINSPYNTAFPFLPAIDSYQKIKSTILVDQKRESTYDKAFARGNTVIDLVNQIEKDVFEIKSNQYALQQILISTQRPGKQNISPFTPMPTR
jgi:hypothetical protein